MKPLNTMIAAALLGLAICNPAYSQPESKEVTEEANAATMKKDHLMMKKGKMMVMKDGKEMKMDKDMTMTDGTKVMMDGTCMMKDGKKMMMSNGDKMMMDGKMMPGKMNKDHLMMKDGKMMEMKGGKEMMMEKDMTLPDGPRKFFSVKVADDFF